MKPRLSSTLLRSYFITRGCTPKSLSPWNVRMKVKAVWDQPLSSGVDRRRQWLSYDTTPEGSPRNQVSRSGAVDGLRHAQNPYLDLLDTTNQQDVVDTTNQQDVVDTNNTKKVLVNASDKHRTLWTPPTSRNSITPRGCP